MENYISPPVGGAPRNLLDNSDFCDPVNQRDATIASNYNYAIDRWQEYAGQSSAYAFDAGGMTLTGVLAQKILASVFAGGETYTAALYMADGSVLAASGAVNIAGSPWTGFASAERGNVKIALFTDSPDGSYIGVRIGASGEKIRACALYEGEYTADTLPPYAPKGYEVELIACQRYYTRGTYILAHEFSSGLKIALTSVVYPVPMRVTPTVYIINTKYWASQADAGITAERNIGDNLGFNSLNLGAVPAMYPIQFDYISSADL